MKQGGTSASGLGRGFSLRRAAEAEPEEKAEKDDNQEFEFKFRRAISRRTRPVRDQAGRKAKKGARDERC